MQKDANIYGENQSIRLLWLFTFIVLLVIFTHFLLVSLSDFIFIVTYTYHISSYQASLKSVGTSKEIKRLIIQIN